MPVDEESDMKKIMVFLFCLVIVNSVFCEDVTLTINAKVKGENLIKLSLAPLQNGSSWNNAQGNLTLSFTSPAAKEAYVNLRTNSYINYYINLLGVPLSSDGTTAKIGYTVTPIAGDNYTIGDRLVVDASHTNDSIDHFVTFPIRHGMRVVPAKFSVELNGADWENASEGEYVATVFFDLTTT
jgi:hypothetical protein